MCERGPEDRRGGRQLIGRQPLAPVRAENEKNHSGCSGTWGGGSRPGRQVGAEHTGLSRPVRV